MKTHFGKTPQGEDVFLYTISCGKLQAKISDLGATLVNLYVPDAQGNLADVVLGYDDAAGYLSSTAYFGATVGRNANRIAGASFQLNGKTITMPANEGCNSLHSGPDGFEKRLWIVTEHCPDRLELQLSSPHGDQGLPGNMRVCVRYTMESDGLQISYEAVSDRDTLLNMTNHSYFNLAGHEHPEKAMDQVLLMPARHFCPADANSIPTGQTLSVEDTPMDFRIAKPIGRDIQAEYEALQLQKGYDHTFEVFCCPAAVLTDPESGRTMAVITDCPGMQLYSGNYNDTTGKNGVYYGMRSGVALETQFYPDAVHHESWKQPILRAGKKFYSRTKYRFTW